MRLRSLFNFNRIKQGQIQSPEVILAGVDNSTASVFISSSHAGSKRFSARIKFVYHGLELNGHSTKL